MKIHNTLWDYMFDYYITILLCVENKQSIYRKGRMILMLCLMREGGGGGEKNNGTGLEKTGR